jgi:hypothetical protein
LTLSVFPVAAVNVVVLRPFARAKHGRLLVALGVIEPCAAPELSVADPDAPPASVAEVSTRTRSIPPPAAEPPGVAVTVRDI